MAGDMFTAWGDNDPTGLGGFIADLTGSNKRREQAQQAAIRDQQLARQQAFDKTSGRLVGAGEGMVNPAAAYWRNWLTNPSAAWNATSGIASNMAGNQANAASRGAVDAARSAGLNPGQAAMMGAQTVADSFNNAYGATQNQLMGQQQQSAGNSANTGLGQQNIGLGFTGQGTASLGQAAGTQQQLTGQAIDANTAAGSAVGDKIAQKFGNPISAVTGGK